MSRSCFLYVVVIAVLLFKGLNAGVTNNNCKTGYQGADCDECGKVFATQNVKIVGGVSATANSWPSIAYVTFKYKQTYRLPTGVSVVYNSGSSCGGTLIDKKFVLTAAHCIPSTVSFTYQGVAYSGAVTPNTDYPTYGSMFTVYLGLHLKSQLNTLPSVAMSVSSVKKHESYSTTTLVNDIAILTLTNKATLNNYIQIACLPTSSSDTYPGTNVDVYAAGWGTLSSGGSTPDALNNVKLTAYAASSCSTVATLTTAQICAGESAGGKDTCQGDSGGPLYKSETINSQSKFVVSGVVSWGAGCAQVGKPGVYTRVSSYLDWIKSNTNKQDRMRSHVTLIVSIVFLSLFFDV
jgi:secreted trypsin-like serine protease